MRTLPSRPNVANLSPLSSTDSPRNPALSPLKVIRFDPVAVSQTRAVPSRPAV
jgi:hypothetical protein